jgi:hypothetical protein
MGNDAVARHLWALYEPIHAVTYFAAQSRAAFESAGLRGFWRGYFAGRAAPLGPVGAAPVVAAFFGFAPAMVARALPDVWSRATPQAALDARRAGARGALLSLLDGAAGLQRAATVLREAAQRVQTTGRVLAAANAALPWPDEPVDVLWHAATLLREHRGDGHVAALVTAGLDGCESLVWRTALRGGGREDLQAARGWTDQQWVAAQQRLRERGWLDAHGAPTAAARDAHADIEHITDQLAAQPWRGADVEVALGALRPLAERVAASLPYPNPIGLPDPRTNATA